MTAPLDIGTGLFDLAERIGAAKTGQAAGAALMGGLADFGAISLVTTAEPFFPDDDPGPDVEFVPAGWRGSEDQRFNTRHNPHPAFMRTRRSTFRWREAPVPKPVEGAYWESLRAYGGQDGIVVPLPDLRRHYRISMAFGTRDWGRREQLAIEFACLTFLERFRTLLPAPPDPPHLTPRERDAIGFVAEGKTDWEISVILGISQNTAHQHVESARKKLGAATRAQAAARFVMLSLR